MQNISYPDHTAVHLSLIPNHDTIHIRSVPILEIFFNYLPEFKVQHEQESDFTKMEP